MPLAPFEKIAYGRPTMARSIVIYQDEGVGEFGLACLRRFFANDAVTLASAEDVVAGEILQTADLFVMPGGADLPYCRKLNGTGNNNIRNFVESGGTYLGICAGAYYACRAIEFHKGRDDEICQLRELSLVDAVAVGSLPELAPYYDDRLRTVAAVSLQASQEIFAYYHGGCQFILNEDAIVHARYNIVGEPAAIIEKHLGQGRVILSGVHLEILSNDVKDYPLEEGDDPAQLDQIASELKNPHELLQSILKERLPW